MCFDFYQIYILRKSLMKKIGVLLFFCTCKCHKVLNYEYKKEKKGSWWGNWGEESRRNEEGNQPTCVHNVEGAIERPAAFVYETGNNNALPTTAAILSWIEVLFEGPWKIGEGGHGDVFVGWEAHDDDRIAPFGWKWSQSWQFVVTRENLWLCAGWEEIIVFFFLYVVHVNCLTLKYLSCGFNYPLCAILVRINK